MAAKTKGGVYKKTQKLFPFRIDYWPDNYREVPKLLLRVYLLIAPIPV